MKSIILNFILTAAVVILLYIVINRPVVVPVDGNVDAGSSIENPDRESLIKKIIKGDSEAAMKLERFYGTRDLPEASLYWLKAAKSMGRSDISQELIDACERSILNEYREPSK